MAHAARDESGKILPGNTANPKGRKPISQGGKPNDPYNIRALIAENADDIVQSMIKAAKEGDVTAADKLLSYIIPKLSAVAVQTDEKGALPIMRVINALQQAPGESIDNLEKEKKESGSVIDASSSDDAEADPHAEADQHADEGKA